MRLSIVCLTILTFFTSLTLRPEPARADWVKKALVVGGGIALGYAVYRGYQNHKRQQEEYERRLFSYPTYPVSTNSSSSYYQSRESESDRAYQLYLTKWSKQREADYNRIRAAHGVLETKVPQKIQTAKAAWLCASLCGQDVAVPDQTGELNGTGLKILTYTSREVFSEGASPEVAFANLERSCATTGAGNKIYQDAMIKTSEQVSNIGLVTAYAGNSCHLTRTMTYEQARAASTRPAPNLNDLKGAFPYRSTVTKVEVMSQGETPSDKFLKEFWTTVKADLDVPNLGEVADDGLKALGGAQGAEELLKNFSIGPDPNEQGVIAMYDRRKLPAEREIARIKPILVLNGVNGPQIETMRVELEMPFTVIHPCGPESYRVRVVTQWEHIKNKPTPLIIDPNWKSALLKLKTLAGSSEKFCR